MATIPRTFHRSQGCPGLWLAWLRLLTNCPDDTARRLWDTYVSAYPCSHKVFLYASGHVRDIHGEHRRAVLKQVYDLISPRLLFELSGRLAPEQTGCQRPKAILAFEEALPRHVGADGQWR
jgi:hypothetical protein